MNTRSRQDWLVDSEERPASIRQLDGGVLVLENGLIRRTFTTQPNFATLNYENLTTGASLLRGIKPESIIEFHEGSVPVGGLIGQPEYAYLDPSWIPALASDPSAFEFAGLEEVAIQTRYPWKPKRSAGAPWPPEGVGLKVTFRPPRAGPVRAGLQVSVGYELYDGIPVLSKALTVIAGEEGVDVDALTVELLAINEREKARIHVESDYSFHGAVTTKWEQDPQYETQVVLDERIPLLMTSRYPTGPGIHLNPGEAFHTFRTFELLLDSDDRERRGLARRRFYRTLAPQITENPITFHVSSSDPDAVRNAIDQCVEVGFEMVIISFWSGFEIERGDEAYVSRFRELADYAHQRGIEFGCYTLMCASKDVGPEMNVISPETGKPGSKWGQSACLASEWFDIYSRMALGFVDRAGFDVLETDGPYHGDPCASTVHKYHTGLADSQLRQWEQCVKFYGKCRERGLYVDAPDWYYLSGTNKCGMGYRELNFNLPLWRQITISRQNIYDGTFDKTPSMGWMFVPLVKYREGGPAILEPLSKHAEEYEWYLAQNFGSGVQACYRGIRLYDSEETRSLVRKWVSFYKRHREILDSDIIHLRRPDGRGIDCMMHVNPGIVERALGMVFNPTEREIDEILEVPLHYTGLNRKARLKLDDEPSRCVETDTMGRISVPLRIGPRGISYFVVTPPDA